LLDSKLLKGKLFVQKTFQQENIVDHNRNPCKMFVTHSIYYNIAAGVLGLNLGAPRQKGIIPERFYLGWDTIFATKYNIDKFILYPSCSKKTKTKTKKTRKVIKGYGQVNAFYVTEKRNNCYLNFRNWKCRRQTWM